MKGLRLAFVHVADYFKAISSKEDLIYEGMRAFSAGIRDVGVRDVVKKTLRLSVPNHFRPEART